MLNGALSNDNTKLFVRYNFNLPKTADNISHNKAISDTREYS